MTGGDTNAISVLATLAQIPNLKSCAKYHLHPPVVITLILSGKLGKLRTRVTLSGYGGEGASVVCCEYTSEARETLTYQHPQRHAFVPLLAPLLCPQQHHPKSERDLAAL